MGKAFLPVNNRQQVSLSQEESVIHGTPRMLDRHQNGLGSPDEKTSFISDTCETVIAAVELLGDCDAFRDLK